MFSQLGRPEEGIEYAQGALVNAQVLAGVVTNQRPTAAHPLVDPFFRLMADLLTQVGQGGC